MPAAEPLQESRAPNAGLGNAGIAVPSASRYGQSSSALRIPVHEDPGAVGRTGRHQSSGHLSVQHGAACADMLPSSRTSQCNSSRTAGSIGPAWVEPGLQCLCAALQSSNVKVQWNACYAVGALLRCQQAAAAAQRAGLMQDLLQQLLQTLKHSSNFKASILSPGQNCVSICSHTCTFCGQLSLLLSLACSSALSMSKEQGYSTPRIWTLPWDQLNMISGTVAVGVW